MSLGKAAARDAVRGGAPVAVLASRRVRFRAVTALLVAAAVFLAAAADISAARAEPADRLWKDLQNQASECGTAGNRSLSEGASCLAGNGLAFLFEEGVRQTQDYGRAAFGPHFGMVGNAAPAGSLDRAGLAGDLDVVVPLAGGGPAPAGRPPGSALFLQQGRHPLAGRLQFVSRRYALRPRLAIPGFR